MNRLRSQDAVLNIQLRKKRTQRLIELGGLVSKAQLEDWNANTLLGALLFLKEREVDLRQLEEWRQRGGMVFNEGKTKNLSSKKEGKKPVFIKCDIIKNPEINCIISLPSILGFGPQGAYRR